MNTKIQAFEVVINDPAASEETKNRAAKVSKETQAKIDAIIKKKPPIVPPATGGAMVEAEPIAKPTFDTEEQLIEEGKTAEEEYKKTGDQVTYEQKIKELEEREKNLVPAPEDAEIGKPEEVVEVEPIRQLGTGANVYFETEKYRVNDGLKKGNVLLNIQSKTSEAPIANIEFDNANDAVIIAQELNNKFPDGVPDAILIDKYIEQLKNDLLKPQEDAIQEQGLQKPIKSTTFVNEEIKPNIISEGSQKESRVDSKTVRNFKEKDTVERNNSSIQTWLESISRNDKKEKRNEGEELFGESVFSKESQAGVLLDDIYRKWQSLRAQTLDESKVGQDIGTTRTRTSLEQQRVGQQNRELAIIDELRAQETSQQDSEQGNISENSRKKQVEAGRMVEKILELSSLPNDPKKASVARALRDLLSSSTQKEKELIINEIKNKLYAVSQSISSKVPVLTEATVGEEVEQGKPEPEAEVVTEEGAKAEEVGSGVDVASKILDLLSKSDEKGVNRIKRRSEVSGISLIEAAKEYLENFQSLSGTGKNRFEELQIQASEQTKPQQLKAEKPIVSKEAVSENIEQKPAQEVGSGVGNKKEVSSEREVTINKTVKLKDGTEVKLKYMLTNEPDNTVAYILGFDKNNNQISTVMIEKGRDGKWKGNDLSVEKKYRRKGLATAMYDFADSEGHNLTPTNSLQPDGKEFWKNRKGQVVGSGVGGDVESTAKALEEKYGIILDLTENKNGDLSIGRIIVPKENRGKGVGKKAMQDIVDYADNNDRRILLTPSIDFGATSVARLKEFYKEFGFIENKGKNKDFTTKDSMYRNPQLTQEVTPAQQVEQLRAEEQSELNDAIPNADQYLTDGKVDRAKITDAKDLKKFDKIYDKYDKLITPLLPKKEAKAEEVERTEFDNEEDAELYDISRETDPNVIADKYYRLPSLENTDYKGYQLAQAILGKRPYKVSLKEWTEYGGDKSQDDLKKYKRFIKEGKGDIDDVTGILTERFGVEVTPEDIVETIINYGNKSEFNRKGVSNVEQALLERYFDLTGKRNITEAAAKKGFDAVNKKNKASNKLYVQKEALQEAGITEEDIAKEQEFASEGFGELETPLEKFEYQKKQISKKGKTKIEIAREIRLKAKAAVDEDRKRFGIAFDPENRAKVLFNYHKALVGEALAYIGEGINNVKDFAREIGEDIENIPKAVRDAWNEAYKGIKKREKDFLVIAEEEEKQIEKERLRREDLGLVTPKLEDYESEEPISTSKDFESLAYQAIESDEFRDTLSNKERESGKTLTRAEKRYQVNPLMAAFELGESIVAKAKEEFGDTYVNDLLAYIAKNQNTLGVDKSSLILLTLENDLNRQQLSDPNNITLAKQERMVQNLAIAYQRSAARAVGYGRLRQIARVGYDVDEVTNQLFSSEQVEGRRKVVKAMESTADEINDEAELQEQETEGELIIEEPKVKRDAKQVRADIKEVIKQMRADLVKSARGAGGALSAIPFAQQVKDVTPHIIKLSKLFAELGGMKTKDIVAKIRKSIKGLAPDVDETVITDILKGEKTTPKKAPKDRLEQTKDAVKARIEELKQEIEDKRKELKVVNKVKSDAELDLLLEQEKELKKIANQYLTQESIDKINESKEKSIVTKLENEIANIDEQIANQQKLPKSSSSPVTSLEITLLKAQRKARIDVLNELDPNPKAFTKQALIDAGYSREITVTTKQGKEKRQVLDWKKLAGNEMDVNAIKNIVEQALKDKGFTPAQISRMQDAFVNEFTELRASVIDKSLNTLRQMNEPKKPSERKSSARQLAELFDFGLFNQDPDKFNYLLNKILGLSDLDQESFFELNKLSEAIKEINLMNSNEFFTRQFIREINLKITKVLNKVARQQGSTSFKVVSVVAE